MTYIDQLDVILEDLESRLPEMAKTVLKGIGHKSIPLSRFAKAHKINLENPEVAAPAVVRAAAVYDPTAPSRAAYTQWLLKLIITGNIRLPEDQYRFKEAIAIFDRVKKSKRYTGPKDVTALKSFQELEDITTKFQNEAGEDVGSVTQWRSKIIAANTVKLLEDSTYQVIQIGHNPTSASPKIDVCTIDQKNWFPTWSPPTIGPDTKDAYGGPASLTSIATTEAALVVSIFAKGTRWCISHPTTAESYLRHGPMMIFFRKGEKLMLATGTFGECRDLQDKALEAFSEATCICVKKLLDGGLLPEIAQKNMKRFLVKSINVAQKKRAQANLPVPPILLKILAEVQVSPVG